MHKIITTQGIIVSKRAAGEANTLVTLLTHELGLVRVSARSARLERSKLRYGLEPLTRGRFSLVRGRYEWKLTGVHDLSHDCLPLGAIFPLSDGASNRARAGKIAKLIARLMPGEEPVPQLYQDVIEGLQALARMGEAEQSAESIECVLVLRILARLGYLPQSQTLAPFIKADFFSLELVGEVVRSRAQLLRTINESLKATGL